MRLVVEELPALRGFAVEWAEPGNHYLSRRNVIYRSATLEPPFEVVATIDAPWWRAAASRARLAQRLLRFMVANVVELPGGELFVTFDRSIGIVREGTWRQLGGLARPCRVLRSGCAVDRHGDVYFGEYRMNPERGEVNVYRYRAGEDAVEVVHTFQAGEIAHVHGIYADERTGALFCLTGDDERECRIVRSFDGFASHDVVGQQDETWRAVTIQFSGDHYFYGTDASFRTNHLYRARRDTMEREVLAEIDGPVLSSARLGDTLLFATSAEGAPSQPADVATLWSITEGSTCTAVASFHKDRWPRTLFKLGTIDFPYRSTSTGETYLHLTALVGDDRTYRVRAAPHGEPAAGERP